MPELFALGTLSGRITVHGSYRLRHVLHVASVSAGTLADTTMLTGGADALPPASVRWRIEILEGDIATLQLSALEQFALQDATEHAPTAGVRTVRVSGGLNGRVAQMEITG